MGSFNHNDTIKTTAAIATPILSWDSDYVLKSSDASEVVYTYTKSDADQPETIRIANADVQNVYANTEISPSLFSVSKKGRRLLISALGTYRVTDAAGNVTDYPVKTGITAQFPVSANVDADAIVEMLKRSIAVAFNGEDSSKKMNELMRGVVLQ